MKNKLLFILTLVSFVGFILMLILIPNPSWWETDLMLGIVLVFLLCIMRFTKKKKPHIVAEKNIQKAIVKLSKMEKVEQGKYSLSLIVIKNDLAYALDKLDICLAYYEKYELKFAIEKLKKILDRYVAFSDNADKLEQGTATSIYTSDIKALEQLKSELHEIFKDVKK